MVDTKVKEPAHYVWRLSVVTDAGSVIATQDGEALRDRSLSSNSLDKVATNDFDGDGTDEIVVTVGFAYKFSETRDTVVVYGVQGGSFKHLLRRGYSYTSREHSGPAPQYEYVPGVPLCEGSYGITSQGALEIHGTLLQPLDKFKDEKPECVNGTETYVAGNGGLVKL